MLLRQIENALDDGNDDEAVRGRQEQKLWGFLACRAEGLLNVALPVLLKQFRVLGGLDVQRDHFRGEPCGKFNSLAGNVAPAVNGNDRNGWVAETRRLDGNLTDGEELYGVVVAADHGKENNRQRNEKQRNPGAFSEFRNEYD